MSRAVSAMLVGLGALVGVSVCLAADEGATAPAGTEAGRFGRRRVAVTFDDLPAAGLPGRGSCDAEALMGVNHRLLAQIDARNVPATGFVTESRVCDELREDLLPRILELWLDAGHDLGNHTFSHSDLNRTPVVEYELDIELGGRTTSRVLAERGREIRWFRYPMLHTGSDRATRQTIEGYLEDQGYENAPVTLDNQEWVFAAVYSRALAKGDDDLAVKVARAYLDFMIEVFVFFEEWSREVVGYEPPQVLLVHANELNADHFAELAERIAGRGYEFVTLEEAMRDPAYELEDGYVGPRGLSWVHRWAMGKGLGLREEPREPGWVGELFQGDG